MNDDIRVQAHLATFNSLFRDHMVADFLIFLNEKADRKLSTPSFGITRMICDANSFYTWIYELSTPSFGITEPDSGIFRLSAAFCRGTSSHN